MSTSWAVVTGASGGLGETYAHELASQGSDVVLVARSENELHRVAIEIERAHGVRAMVLVADLSDSADRARLLERLAELDVHTLVNNAGFGTMGQFASLPAERLTAEMQLNVVALTELTRTLVPRMVERGRGAVINVASTAAFQPIPGMAVYAATKSYVLRLSIALWAELHSSGVRVVCICPGPTRTNFFDNAGDGSVMSRRREPIQVVASTFEALEQHRPYVVDGFWNKVLAHSNRLVPSALAARIAQRVATAP